MNAYLAAIGRNWRFRRAVESTCNGLLITAIYHLAIAASEWKLIASNARKAR